MRLISGDKSLSAKFFHDLDVNYVLKNLLLKIVVQ